MPMSGPIVRSGPTPEFSKNWDAVFAGKKPAAAKSKSSDAKAKASKKAGKKSPKKAAKKGKK